MKIRIIGAVQLLILVVLLNGQPVFSRSVPSSIVLHRLSFAEKFYRTELYFGTGKPDGTAVTDEEWSGFLAEEITPRFPEGFTVLEAYGQFKDSGGNIVKEKSRCVILLYAKKNRAVNSVRVEQIRTAYKRQFQQESVLRLDFRQAVGVSF